MKQADHFFQTHTAVLTKLNTWESLCPIPLSSRRCSPTDHPSIDGMIVGLTVSTVASRAQSSDYITTQNDHHYNLNGGRARCAHGIQNAMEAILTCHPALSTKRLDWVAKCCERWRMRTGPILTARQGPTNMTGFCYWSWQLSFQNVDFSIVSIPLEKLEERSAVGVPSSANSDVLLETKVLNLMTTSGGDEGREDRGSEKVR